ncbi:PREDICTED: vacuolar amino acid transporter 1-like [Ipomoea nil]|uniref:vacuolar amino acid transporter 1-like n=1 Tax=Ipomoea nil TaxID=35883 RepID=UPI000900D627|nr:PREDICTED: vacuolar amino acid transporter 1-like [Ipomoea nil]
MDDGHSITVHLLKEHDLQKEAGDHRRSFGSASFLNTCFNGLNALSGIGILSVPFAVASGGWLSLIYLFIIAAATCYTAVLIQRCMDMDAAVRNYPDIGERAFGAVGRAVVSLSMNVELYMVAAGFLIMEGDNLNNLFPDFRAEVFGAAIGGKQCWVIVVSLLVLPTVWFNDLRVLSYVSATGVVASFLLLAAVLWTAVSDNDSGAAVASPPANRRLVNWGGTPTAVSLYAFCYCAHPVFPTLYTSMKNPTHFSKVLLVCFAVSTFNYASMAILGYLMFGSDALSQITLNLPTDKISSQVAIYVTLVNPIAKYALMVTPIVKAIENSFALSDCGKKGLIGGLVIRTGLVISTVIVAMAVPFFGYLMSLVGAFLSTAASVILPCLCFLKISGIHRTAWFEVVVICGIVVMGFGFMIVGTYTALMEIVCNFTNL